MLALLLLSLSGGAAHAGNQVSSVLLQEDPATALATPAPVPRRNFLMELNFRGRYLSIPDSILDIWFFDSDDPPGHPDRPQARAWSTGLEYVLQGGQDNGIFYVEYVGSLMDEGYWDDREEPAIETDGDYIVPDRFGMVGFGANYAREIEIQPWLSLMVGGGLGAAVITGQLTQWNPGALAPDELNDPYCTEGSIADPSAPAWERYEAGCGDDGPKHIPEVLPIVDITMGVRFNFNDRAHLRLEGGFHDLLYMGMATGVVF